MPQETNAQMLKALKCLFLTDHSAELLIQIRAQVTLQGEVLQLIQSALENRPPTPKSLHDLPRPILCSQDIVQTEES